MMEMETVVEEAAGVLDKRWEADGLNVVVEGSRFLVAAEFYAPEHAEYVAALHNARLEEV